MGGSTTYAFTIYLAVPQVYLPFVFEQFGVMCAFKQFPNLSYYETMLHYVRVLEM